MLRNILKSREKLPLNSKYNHPMSEFFYLIWITCKLVGCLHESYFFYFYFFGSLFWKKKKWNRKPQFLRWEDNLNFQEPICSLMQQKVYAELLNRSHANVLFWYAMTVPLLNKTSEKSEKMAFQLYQLFKISAMSISFLFSNSLDLATMDHICCVIIGTFGITPR